MAVSRYHQHQFWKNYDNCRQCQWQYCFNVFLYEILKFNWNGFIDMLDNYLEVSKIFLLLDSTCHAIFYQNSLIVTFIIQGHIKFFANHMQVAQFSKQVWILQLFTVVVDKIICRKNENLLDSQLFILPSGQENTHSSSTAASNTSWRERNLSATVITLRNISPNTDSADNTASFKFRSILDPKPVYA